MAPAQRKILELTKKPKSFSELKKDTGLTDGGLFKALQSLEKNGYITKTDLGYLITTKGLKVIEENIYTRRYYNYI